MIKKLTTVTALILALVISLGCMEPAYAASAKKPKAPKITTASADGTTVTLSWRKAKYAKKYQIAKRTTGKVWVKYKTVKKSKKNKKKFTKANKYRVVPKGKKYLVYKYEYKYSLVKTVKNNSVRLSRINGDGLKSYADYTFAVRSVNGKKYSAWKTAAVRTGAFYDWITVNGRSIKVTEGEKITLPMPVIPGVSVEKDSLDIIPQREDFYDYFVDQDGSIRISGKDPEGNEAYYTYDPDYRVMCTRRKYTTWDERERYGYLAYGTKYMGWPTEFNIHIFDPDMKAVWTLDGTEPQKDQETLVVDSSQYPFGTWTKDSTVTLRGTTTESTQISEVRWADSRGYYTKRSAPIAVWAKLYYKDTLVEEMILIEK